MAKTQALTTPTPMEGHGAYTRSSQVQAAGLSPAVPLLEKAAKQVPLPPDRVGIPLARMLLVKGE